MTADPLGDWEVDYFPMTPVHHEYVRAFEDWLRAPEDRQAKDRERMRNLVDLMRLDRP